MIHKKIFCAFIVFLAFASYQSLTESCEIYKFAKQEGLALVNHVIKKISRGLVEACWYECFGLPECFSINVRRVFDVLFECELNNSTKQASPSGDLIVIQGSEYHDMVNVESKYCSLYQCGRKQILSDGWFGLGLSAVKLFTQSKNWTAARQHCKSLGGELVSIASSHKDDFIYNVLVKEFINSAINNKSSGAAPPTDTYWALDGHDKDVLLFEDAEYQTHKSSETSLRVRQTSFAKVPAFPFNSEGFTLAFWIFINRSPGDWENTILSDIRAGDLTFRINRKLAEKQLIFTHYTPGQTVYATIKTAEGKIPRVIWEHIAITFNKTEERGRILLDGTPVSTTLTPKPFKQGATTKISTKTHYKIGSKKAVASTDENPFNGNMKYLMLFDRELNTDEIKFIMNWSEYGPWIGLFDDTADKMYIWSDGSSIGQYVPLPGYRPNTPSNTASCVAMKKNGKWINRSCSEKRPFICQRPIA